MVLALHCLSDWSGQTCVKEVTLKFVLVLASNGLQTQAPIQKVSSSAMRDQLFAISLIVEL